MSSKTCQSEPFFLARIIQEEGPILWKSRMEKPTQNYLSSKLQVQSKIISLSTYQPSNFPVPFDPAKPSHEIYLKPSSLKHCSDQSQSSDNHPRSQS